MLSLVSLEFKVITDETPLVALLNNPSSKPSAKNRMLAHGITAIRFTVEYYPGASNPADYTSRHPIGDPEFHNYEVESEEHISFVASNAVLKAIKACKGCNTSSRYVCSQVQLLA